MAALGVAGDVSLRRVPWRSFPQTVFDVNAEAVRASPQSGSRTSSGRWVVFFRHLRLDGGVVCIFLGGNKPTYLFLNLILHNLSGFLELFASSFCKSHRFSHRC